MESIVQYLKDNGIKEIITIGTVIDGEGIGLIPSVGTKVDYYMDNTIVYDEGLQIVVRSNSYSKGEEIARSVFVLLNKLESYKGQHSPLFIGYNEKHQAEFTVNYLITRDGEF